jgi:hypothetical protein
VKKRFFVPANPDYMVIIGNRHTGVRGSVRYWSWTARKGLVCHYRNGFNCKSDWGTLPAFLKAVKERRETAIREVDPKATEMFFDGVDI